MKLPRRLAEPTPYLRLLARHALGLGWLVLCLLPAPTTARAEPIEYQLGPGEEALIDTSGDPQDEDDTGVRIKNLSSEGGLVVVDFDPSPQQGKPPEGFEVVDGTLIVQSTLPPGELRARYRVEYDVRRIRALGLRTDTVVMMRRARRGTRFGRAVDAIRGRATIRYLRERRADFVLGHHGYSQELGYVWAVVDVNSQYAVGAKPQQGSADLPALAPSALMGLGAVLLGGGLLRTRIRR